ncbi:hypothetical protein PV10_02063 [Exophiala mesophila]|uniref:Cytidyltransferase-like domain-containing protein n=1 Tax=Exophiala mesophila TaxID=212818 RepID=A0A0D1Y171_EXOME|nr:uncharacterized protein PV10_02063 [Exophiala mesophila]KIV94281.1 hypothetical protein PV10_02063 [Exophiala mesophila]
MAPISSSDSASLLLLPALSISSPTSSLRSAYKTSLETLFPRLVASGSTATISRLDIALCLHPSYPASTTHSRSAVFAPLQRLLSSVYSLVVSVAATSHIDLDLPGGLDVRVFFVDSPVEGASSSGKQHISGPVVDLLTLVTSLRHYSALYSVDGEAGESFLKLVTTTYNSKNQPIPPIHRLPAGPSLNYDQNSSQPSNSLVPDGPVTSHASVAVGGTFDHLHIGHKLLLTCTILAADPQASPRLITCGITGDELLVNKKYGSIVESWHDRQVRTAQFVESILAFHPDVSSLRKTEYLDSPGPNGKVVRVTYSTPPMDSTSDDSITINYTQLSDPYGPTITDQAISAIVISAETRAGGKAVNDKRQDKGWKPLEVFEIDVLDAGSIDDAPSDTVAGHSLEKGFADKISSTEIRRRLLELQEKST